MAQLAKESVYSIFYNQVMDKGTIRHLIGKLVAYLKSDSTSPIGPILDQIKTLGFRHATQVGISLGIDDLSNTPSKAWLIQDAEHQVRTSEEQYRCGSIHAVERLRHVVETWHTISEYLKREMNPHFRTTDPMNPVHMMSFSGARGSISQIHQLVGMRGLMSDPQGNIIDLPIQGSFREGLSLTEYIISCYGARKGVVDTAVRTADAGYLTRRLIEVVQHVVIRHRDCKTVDGVHLRSIRDRKGSGTLLFVQDRLIGRILAKNVYFKRRCIGIRNQEIGPTLANHLASLEQEILVRSPLTCNSMPRACQLCYGWDLSSGTLVGLGTAIGIIAGQSIGEPGTQLTLRTFHTGGVFTGDVAEHVRAPFNGVVRLNTNTIKPTRNRHGCPAWICPEAFPIVIEGENGKKHVLQIPQYSLLLVRNHQYVQSKQLIAEVRTAIAPLKEKVEKHSYAGIQGRVYYKHNLVSSNNDPFLARGLVAFRENISLNVEQTGHIWILSCRFNEFSNQAFYSPLLFNKPKDQIQTHFSISKNISIFNKKNGNQYSGFVYDVNIKEKWMMMLSFVDQFYIPICMSDTINKIANIHAKRIINYPNNPDLLFNENKNQTHVLRSSSTFHLHNKLSDSKNVGNRMKSTIGIPIGFLGNLFMSSKLDNIDFLKKTSLVVGSYSNYDKRDTIGKEIRPFVMDENKNIHKLQYNLKFTYLFFWLYKDTSYLFSKYQKTNFSQALWQGISAVSNGVFRESGCIVAECEDNLMIRLAKVYLVTAKSRLHAYSRQMVYEGDTLITFVYERLKASDIIQGLPKAEQLLEARLGSTVVVSLHMCFEYLVEHIKKKLEKYIRSLTQTDLMLSQVSVNRAWKALKESQIETVDQVQKVYLSQGVSLSDKHVELIVRQMSCKVLVVETIDLTAVSPTAEIRTSFPLRNLSIFLPGELIDISKARRINRTLKKSLHCKPLLLGITKASLNTNSFLSEASFERTIRVLSRSALQGRLDWIKGLKENVLISHMIPAGTGCPKISLQVALCKKQSSLIKKYNSHLFINKSNQTYSFEKYSFFNRDSLHNKIQQSIQLSISQTTEDKLVQHSNTNQFSLHKER
jgi:hypothetical protein